ncbi:hypothetical protein [Nitrosomonas sp. Nm58]|nr:hypothetical protein [Nitrosomonas sp. Nm58]
MLKQIAIQVKVFAYRKKPSVFLGDVNAKYRQDTSVTMNAPASRQHGR